tara:strand:+ start:43 stop:435 length:393 start_codon:yes stop_codon:yes gene_type:complete
MKSFKEFQESVAQEVGGKSLTGAVIKGVANVAAGPIKKAAKVANVFRSSKGKDILQGLFGTPDKPKDQDWENNPKDDIDSELNVRQRQAKDAAKNKEFDTDMDALRKGEKNLSPEDKIQRLKDAAKKKKK